MMDVAILGIGVWGGGTDGWESLCQVLDGEPAAALPGAPKAELIPPRERRRAPVSVRLAVEVAAQACASAQVDAAQTSCVFGSGMGDMDITDYMCRTLAHNPSLLSPTRFHNSVHNAPAGYWTIATGCRQSANAVCAYEYTFPAALMEAAILCAAESRPVLLALQDVMAPPVFMDLTPVTGPFACALVIAPTDPASSRLPSVTLTTDSADAVWPELDCEPLDALYASNPSARALALLSALAGRTSTPVDLHWPLSHQMRLTTRVVA